MYTLDQCAKVVGRRYLIGAVWMAILRSPRAKLSGLKYLSKRLPKLKSDDDEEEIN
jgi:hypothetical protein